MRIIDGIKNFAFKHTLLFSVFSLLFVFSVCGVLYTVNFLNNMLKRNSAPSEEERTYTVEVSGDALDGSLSRLTAERDDLERVYCIIYNGGDTVIADYFGCSARTGVSYGRWFSDEDIALGKSCVILPNYPYFSKYELGEYEMLDIGDGYSLFGTEYEAIGIGRLSEFVYQIPYSSIDDKSKISAVAVVFEEVTVAGDGELSAYLEETLSGRVASRPTVREDRESSSRYLLEGAFIVGIILSSVFTLAYIYAYILDSRKKEIAINRISGATVFSGVTTALGEIFLLLSVEFLLCVLLMETAVFPSFAEDGILCGSLGALHYLAVYLGLELLFAAVFLPTVIMHMRRSPFEALTDE